MRTLSLLIFGMLALNSVCAEAAEKQVWHYLGEVRISTASGRPIPSQVILLEKTHDPEKGVTIEDENFLADPSAAVARKKIMAPDGKVIMYMDLTLKTVTPETFKVLAKALIRK